MSKEFLCQLPLFQGLSAEDLDQLYVMSETVSLGAGDTLMEEGTMGDALYVVLEGRFDIYKRSQQRELLIACRGAGDILGEIALLENAARQATVRAGTDARAVRISRETFRQLLLRSPSALLDVLRTMAGRLRNMEAVLRQSEKMASLGTLAAGLAHEMNNPAAAIRRGAGQLRDVLARLQRQSAALARMEPGSAAIEVTNSLRLELPRRSADPLSLNPLTRGDLEDELAVWMEAQGAADAWELAPPVVALGWTAADLAEMSRAFAPAQVPIFLDWLATGCLAYTLLDEVSRGAERISEIVKSVKSYSHLDRAPVQLIDVHEGLEDTLVILRHKLKKGVSVAREYAESLPSIEAFAGELNQVWTNLIDNAVDAMDGRGELRIRTSLEGERVAVEIADNGPGIPPDVQPRIFDAFFTTKAVGSGTGLGLHISYNIVVNKHRGDIAVRSKPGETVFRVLLPVKLARTE